MCVCFVNVKSNVPHDDGVSFISWFNYNAVSLSAGLITMPSLFWKLTREAVSSRVRFDCFGWIEFKVELKLKFVLFNDATGTH